MSRRLRSLSILPRQKTDEEEKENVRDILEVSHYREEKRGGMVKEGFVKGCSAVREFSCSESICRGSWQIQILTNSLQSLQPSEEAETNISW